MKRWLFRLKYRFFLILILCIGGIVFFISFLFSLFEIKKIIVEPSTISVLVDKNQIPTNLLLFPTDRVRSELLAQYPEIGTITIIKELPHTIRFFITKKEAVSQVSYKGKTYYLDEDSMVFSSAQKYDVPVLALPITHIKEGYKISGTGFDCSLAFIQELRHDEAIERISLSTNDTLEVVLKDTRVLLLVTADGKERADTLQTILKGFRMKGSLPSTLDLRFSKPMILP